MTDQIGDSVTKYLTLIFISFSLISNAGCAKRHYVFKNMPAIETAEDLNASPVPESSKYRTIEEMINSAARHPLVNHLDPRRIERSQDVNSLDELPNSAWYTKRLGYKTISPEEMKSGLEDMGPPQAPITIVKTKSKGNTPGFIIEDKRNIKYLIKLDSPDYPFLESTTNYVVNRLFWAFGYYVPEDYVFNFKESDLKLSTTGNVSQEALDNILLQNIPDENGFYRATASMFIKGNVLGHISQKGTRESNTHDSILHENRRILRALRVFCAFTNQTGIRSDNTLDVYVGEEGQGHTRHYLIDFGEAFGIHGLSWGWNWDGHEHFFSWDDTIKKTLLLGIPVKKWEKLDDSYADYKTYFEGEAFGFDSWKETYQFQPIRSSQPDDDYWAAKVLSNLTKAHLEALFNSAGSGDKGFNTYAIETLLKRQNKIIQSAFSKVTPVEVASINKDALILTNIEQQFFNGSETVNYKVRFFDKNHKSLNSPLLLSENSGQITIPIKDILSEDYIRIEVVIKGSSSGRPAEFHISGSSNPQVIGVTH